MNTIEVPLAAVGLGTGTAHVRDAVSRELHPVSAERLVTVGGVLCVALDSKREAKGMHLVSLPGGQPMVWVRAISPAGA